MPRSYEELAQIMRPATPVEKLGIALAERGSRGIGEILSEHDRGFSEELLQTLAARDQGGAGLAEYVETLLTPGDPRSGFRLKHALSYIANRGDVATLRQIYATTARKGILIPSEIEEHALEEAAANAKSSSVEFLLERAKNRLFCRPLPGEEFKDLGNRVLAAAASGQRGQAADRWDGTPRIDAKDEFRAIARMVLKAAGSGSFIEKRAMEAMLREGVDEACAFIPLTPAQLATSDARPRLASGFIAAAGAQRVDVLFRTSPAHLSDHDVLLATRRVIATGAANPSQAIRIIDLITRGRKRIDEKLQPHLCEAILADSHDVARYLLRRGVELPSGNKYRFHDRLWAKEEKTIAAASRFVDLNTTRFAAVAAFSSPKSNGWSAEKAKLFLDTLGPDAQFLKTNAVWERAVESHPDTVAVFLDAGVGFPLHTAAKILKSGNSRGAAKVVDQHIMAYGFVANEPVLPQLGLRNVPVETQLEVLELVKEKGLQLHEHDFEEGFRTLSPAAQVKLATMASSRARVTIENRDRMLNRESWLQTVGAAPPAGLEDLPPAGFAVGTFNIVKRWITSELQETRLAHDFEAINRASYNLTCTLGTEERVRDLMERHGRPSSNPLFELAEQLPPRPVDLSASSWAALVLQHGPSHAAPIASASLDAAAGAAVERLLSTLEMDREISLRDIGR